MALGERAKYALAAAERCIEGAHLSEWQRRGS